MSLLITVAHQRDSDELTRFTGQHGGGGGGDDGCSRASQSVDLLNQAMQQGEGVTMQGGSSSLVSGYNNRAIELTEMVSALRHVASSGSSEWIQGGNSGFPVISSSSSSSAISGSWIGHKRGREEEMSSGSSHQFIQQQQQQQEQAFPRFFRSTVGEFMVPSQLESSSSISSGATPSTIYQYIHIYTLPFNFFMIHQTMKYFKDTNGVGIPLSALF